MRSFTHLKFRIRCWLDDRLPERRQRLRAAGMLGAISLCAAWIGVFAVGALARGPSGGGGGLARPTPEIRHAQDLQAKLRADAAFAGITILPHLDYPGKLRVSGHAADAPGLKARLAQLDPAASFVIEVR